MCVRNIIASYVNIAVCPITGDDIRIKDKIIHELWKALCLNYHQYRTAGICIIRDGDVYFTNIPNFSIQFIYFSGTYTIYVLDIAGQTIRRARTKVEDVNQVTSYFKSIRKGSLEYIQIGGMIPTMTKSANLSN